MGTAIYTGVSGLLAHQRRMDVVANNIANVNTVGFRGSNVEFQDIMSQTLEGGSAPNGNFAGTNPLQVGLGVDVGSISINPNEGSIQDTGVVTDLAIQGNGLFVLSDGATNFYTRDGSFGRNANGVLIDPATGLKVVGYSANASGVVNTNAAPGDITIPIGTSSIVSATKNAVLAGNLDSNAANGTVVQRTMRVYDSLGTARDVQVTFTKRAQVTDGGTPYNAWLWSAEYGTGNNVTNVPAGESGVVLFDANGAFHAEGSIDNGATDTFKARSTLPSPNAISIPATLLTGGSVPVTPVEFKTDFSKVTDLSASSDISLNTQDGLAPGVMNDFTIAADGTISGVYSNGLTQVVGQIALANFANIGGLARNGSNMFVETPASGVPQIGVPKTGGRGSVAGGELEGSNVDLSTEFSNMIVTERGYQANSRTITVADTLLQEAVNLVR